MAKLKKKKLKKREKKEIKKFNNLWLKLKVNFNFQSHLRVFT